MSVSFTQFNIGEKANLLHALIELSKCLFKLGFYARNHIISVGYDETTYSFVDLQDLGLSPNQLISENVEILEQTGICISYVNPTLELTITARLINHKASSICMLEISDRHFYTFFEPENKNILVGILLASAKSISAAAGFGAMELEWEAYEQNNVIKFLKDGPPAYEGKQPPIGIINTHYLNSNPSLLKDLEMYFDFLIEEEYTILLRKGVSELFSSLRY